LERSSEFFVLNTPAFPNPLTLTLSLIEDKKSYDPDYTVLKDRATADPVANYIEDGLKAGRAYCENFTLRNAAPASSSTDREPDLVRVKEVVAFLKDRNYLVLPTDKNLGSCIVTRQWFIDMTNKLLSDPDNYSMITEEELVKILEIQILKVEDMASLAESALANQQLAEFLWQHAHQDKRSVDNLPVFYGIPKIHKTPTKMRPMIPCHSAIQNPAAKYISKSLKPVLANRPYVLKGTKDMAIRLNSTNISVTRKKFLVSFDVEAFYPNIPVDDAIREVSRTWKEEMQPSLTDMAMFKMGIELACKNLVCQFNGSYFLQAKGIAMGVACSPDIANIYGAMFEEYFMDQSSTANKNVAFYGRFIDDGFMILYADNAAEALSYAKKLVQFGDLNLT
jgi:hypothetical protein